MSWHQNGTVHLCPDPFLTSVNSQKRYERMLKANGVTASKAKGNDSAVPTPEVTPMKRKTAAPRTPVSAKRARGKNVKKESDDDDSKKDVKKQEDTDSELSGTARMLLCIIV